MQAPAVGETPVKPIQNRTPEELKDGLSVTVKGGNGDRDLVVARLLQDAAHYRAVEAETHHNLTDVKLNDRWADRRGALGTARFHGTNGTFTLSTQATTDIVDGIQRLGQTPFTEWSESARNAFLQGNATILHEAGHVTLPEYTHDSVGEWMRADRKFEEGIAEVVTKAQLAPFIEREYGIVVDDKTLEIQQETAAYTRWEARLSSLIDIATPDTQPAAAKDLAERLADSTMPLKRETTLATAMVDHLAGDTVGEHKPQWVEAISGVIPGFLEERRGTRSNIMRLSAALMDVGSGARQANELPELYG